MRRIPCDVLITSSRSSPGSTNASPSTLMLDRADAVWNEMSGWPRYDRETDNTEVLCPVGMEVITDNIISSCGLLGLLYFFHFALESLGLLGFPSVVPPLPFSIYCTVALVQILCKFCVIHYTWLGLNIAHRNMQRHTLFILLVKKFPHHSAVINAYCHAENDFEVCKLNEQEFC